MNNSVSQSVSRSLDVYVFDRISSAHPTQLFKLSGLIKGDAKISGYNSVLTAQVDPRSALNTGKSVTQWMPDLFREFAWNGTVLSQVAFPGLFPDLTRYQAEADQASVNQGHQPWKNDAVQVARALEARFFGWQRPVTFEGTGVAFEAVIGQAVVYDHLYSNIGHAQIIGSNGMGTGTA